MRRILVKLTVLLALACGVTVLVLVLKRPFPSDRTPEGAYVRIAHAVAEGRVREAFPYLETEAQWASFTVRNMRTKASDRIRVSYPEPERSRLLASYEDDAATADGSDLFARMAQRRGWVARLRKDLSGVASIERSGERATVVTARGTRYPMRVRDNGIWGLTIFTAELTAEAERATRDFGVVAAAADDYDRAAPRVEGTRAKP